MYATSSDLVARYGLQEVVRLTTADGDAPGGIVETRAATAIASAAALADSYLRGRYRVPLDIAPIELIDAVCVLARHALALGEQRQPTDQMEKARAEVLAWLKLVAAGTVLIDAPGPSTSSDGEDPGLQASRGARTRDRRRDTPRDYGGFV